MLPLQNEKAVQGPAIVLIEPQLGENIGTVARAMLNFGISDLRLVRPRDGWPNDKTNAAAAGADIVISRAQLFESTEDAIADLNRVYASSGRTRDLVKQVLSPAQAVEIMKQLRGECPESRQVKGAHTGLAEIHGGTSSFSVVSIFTGDN